MHCIISSVKSHFVTPCATRWHSTYGECIVLWSNYRTPFEVIDEHNDQTLCLLSGVICSPQQSGVADRRDADDRLQNVSSIFFNKSLERSYIVLLYSRRQCQGELCYFKSHLDCFVLFYCVVSPIKVNSRTQYADGKVSFLETECVFDSKKSKSKNRRSRV